MCSFLMPWLDHFEPPIGTGHGCLWCQAELDRMAEQFAADVVSGKCDAQGFTPADRRAQHRKQAA